MKQHFVLKKKYKLHRLKLRYSNKALVLLPVPGFCLFIVLYLIAASLYPGGSEADRLAQGFSWRHNYWCDLLETHAENGTPNMARPVAIAAMAVLCASIILFWYFVPRLFKTGLLLERLLQWPGMLSMVVLVFLQTGYHDTIINTAVILGLIAMIVALVLLYSNHYYLIFSLGLFCLLLCGLNIYVYYTKNWIGWLPVIQKISFFLFLLWFSLISCKAYD
jgi:hypothetical protein